MDTSWKETARKIISESLGQGLINKEDHLAIIAVKALLGDLQDHVHPSYSNTAFAVAAFMPKSEIGFMMECLSFDLLVNGLSGYFQWVSHNGGEFSIAKALIQSGVMTAEEAAHPEQFQVCCTHSGCQYLLMKDDFLARIGKKWNLPLSNPELGGKKNDRSPRENELLERLIYQYPTCVSSEGEERIKKALARL